MCLMSRSFIFLPTGLHNLHKLTSQGKFILRIDMEFSSQHYYAKYSDFHIQSENRNFKMSFSAFLGGNAGELKMYRNLFYFCVCDL